MNIFIETIRVVDEFGQEYALQAYQTLIECNSLKDVHYEAGMEFVLDGDGNKVRILDKKMNEFLVNNKRVKRIGL